MVNHTSNGYVVSITLFVTAHIVAGVLALYGLGCLIGIDSQSPNPPPLLPVVILAGLLYFAQTVHFIIHSVDELRR